MKKNNLLTTILSIVLVLFVQIQQTNAQSYHALSGSPYSGVVGIFQNPASSINQGFTWDVSLLGLQGTLSNLAFSIRDASLSSLKYATPEYRAAKFRLINGSDDKKLNGNADIHLLSFRVQLNKKSAFAFALRGRGYLNASAGGFYISEEMNSFQSFLNANRNNRDMTGSVTHNGWLEACFNYSRVIKESTEDRWTVGINMRVMKSLSGFHFNPRKVAFTEKYDANWNPNYNLTSGDFTYMASKNYDLGDSNASAKENFNTILSNSHTNLGLDIGVEYIIKKDYSGSFTSYDAEWYPENYEWKFGASIMDFGTNIFNFGKYSSEKRVPTGKLTDSTIDAYNISRAWKFRDTVMKYFVNSTYFDGTFSVSNPTRIVLYADRNFGNNFYCNAEISVNLYTSSPQSRPRTTEQNFITVTPRWEKRAFGVYMPIQLNQYNETWVGAAFKIGPLLFGVHDFSFTKWFNKGYQRPTGGGYLLLRIHPFAKRKDKADCPY